MATARDIVSRSLRLLGIVKSGDSLAEAYMQDGLIALNALLESWQLEKLNIYAWQDKTFTLVPNDGTITLGATGNITTRPDHIEDVFITQGTIDYPVTMIERGRWDAIADKTTTSNIPELAYYEPSYTQGVLNLYPVPSAANTLHVVMWVPFTAFATLTTSIALPPGYERAMAYNLAIEIAPEYEKPVSLEVQKVATDSLANVKRANDRGIKSYTDLTLLMGGRKSNIEADQP